MSELAGVLKGGHPSTIITVKLLEGFLTSDALGMLSITLSSEDILSLVKIFHQLSVVIR